MPWSGGQFTRIYNWVDDKNAGIPITASRMDGDSDDFASGINNTIAKDGSNTPTANLNIGSFRLTSVGTATALTDAPTMNQLQAGVTNWGVVSGTADALTLTLSPAQTTIADGTLVNIRAASANATTAPTFAFNATTARAITRLGGRLLMPGDIPGQYAESILRYNSANTRWELLNPASQISVLSKSGAAVTAPADTSENILATVTVPANALAANGIIKIDLSFALTNNANVKTIRARISGIGGTVVLSHNAASIDSADYAFKLTNANATNAQKSSSFVFSPTGASGVSMNATSAIDTTATTTIVITAQKASAGDAISLISILAVLYSSGT